MSKRETTGHSVTGVFAFALLGLFAAAAVLTVLMGARFYRNQVDASRKHNAFRILSSYVRSMTRSVDEPGSLKTENVNGLPVLTRVEVYDGDRYVTRLYTSGGYLREWFAAEDYAFEPDKGEIIFAADGFDASMENGLVTASLTAEDGTEISISTAMRAWREEAEE